MYRLYNYEYRLMALTRYLAHVLFRVIEISQSFTLII